MDDKTVRSAFVEELSDVFPLDGHNIQLFERLSFIKIFHRFGKEELAFLNLFPEQPNDFTGLEQNLFVY